WAYEEGRAALVEATVEGEPVAEAVRKLAESLEGGGAEGEAYSGTAAELLDRLAAAMGYGDGQGQKRPPREWPKNARALSGKLRRLAPALRATGTAVDFGREGHKRTRTVTIQSRPEILRPHRPLRPQAGGIAPEWAGNGVPGADANGLTAD